MLTDEVKITFKAGDGGNGKVSFFPGKHSGPDGGGGGGGGNVYIVASPNISNLNKFMGKHVLSAENGKPGDRNNKEGATGADLEINLPVGSLLTDKSTGEEFELTEYNQKILVCKGGWGGRGNSEFKSSTNTTPWYAEDGKPGQIKDFK